MSKRGTSHVERDQCPVYTAIQVIEGRWKPMIFRRLGDGCPLKMLADLREQREQIEQAILALERLALGQSKRRGRPPAWMASAAKRRGRPSGEPLFCPAGHAERSRQNAISSSGRWDIARR
jgi:hypothetical protein